ncbi:hypothetical protein FDB15_18755 [Clostridium botulinum]|uniref:hypothetical protein n=1 Tax=unclassified Clostridium TaxID=2614128 RepID=UPI000540F74C|nr:MULTISPECIES: hypothetical protein [unclassified Clostridium]AIY80341.1 putative dNA replication protein [Clostridium botulinum 202F]KAI3347953.1 hypothetical protein CIT17_06775 [Clostridium botulinum]KON14110.1 hypothetical protein ACP50_04185 [Clostridium botulinum]MBY6986449.1 hypothetical protein [Clostridium botulinum]MBY7009093.1 hypothetical protein [Clostridium botulinum]
MAQRRMFSLKVIDTDMFLDMPQSARLLYYDLSMRADDDGFVASPKKIQRMIGCSDDDFKILIAKRFLIPFESGVCVIKHWRIHNYIRADRYVETIYKDEKQELIEENGQYEVIPKANDIPNVIPTVSNMSTQMDTQVRLGKVRLELGKDSIDNTTKVVSSTKVQPITSKWNELGLQKLISINKGTNRYKLLQARIKEYGEEQVLQAIENIKDSSFLKGQNGKSWTITFDWLIKPNNFVKVLEGNYKDKEIQPQPPNKSGKSSLRFDNFEARNYDYDSLEKKLLGWEESN